MKKKILIVGRSNWDESIGTSSTISNLFDKFSAEDLTYLYIESGLPNTKICSNFFQISEFSLVVKLIRRKVKTGRHFSSKSQIIDINTLSEYNDKEKKSLKFVRKHRSSIFTLAREVLWSLGGWKSKELNYMLENSNFDAIFFFGSPLVFMNRLQRYVIKKCRKNTSVFLMDDMFSYKCCGYNPCEFIHRAMLRFEFSKLIKEVNNVFVISTKMKNEYDKEFGLNSTVLTKGVDFYVNKFTPKKIDNPIKIVYSGQIIYGRYQSIVEVASALRRINADEVKAQLYIYTTNCIPDYLREKLEIEGTSYIMPPVSFSGVESILKSADILLFVESMLPKYKHVARISFSTKIVDYLSSSRAIFAIGPSDIAPIEYFLENDAAFVATNKSEIFSIIDSIVNNPLLIEEYSRKAYVCGCNNHNKLDVYNKINSVLKR